MPILKWPSEPAKRILVAEPCYEIEEIRSRNSARERRRGTPDAGQEGAKVLQPMCPRHGGNLIVFGAAMQVDPREGLAQRIDQHGGCIMMAAASWRLHLRYHLSWDSQYGPPSANRRGV